MSTFELTPTNGRKSFYGKAIVTVNNDVATLTSYTTEVATYNTKTKELTIKGWFSGTTAIHLNAFLEYYGLPKMSKKEIIAYSKNEYEKLKL